MRILEEKEIQEILNNNTWTGLYMYEEGLPTKEKEFSEYQVMLTVIDSKVCTLHFEVEFEKDDDGMLIPDYRTILREPGLDELETIHCEFDEDEDEFWYEIIDKKIKELEK